MVSWMRCHCPPDTGFTIRTLAVWGRARYLSVTEALRNIESLRVSREERFFFEMPERGLRPRPPTFRAGSFMHVKHCTRPPALPCKVSSYCLLSLHIAVGLLGSNNCYLKSRTEFVIYFCPDLWFYVSNIKQLRLNIFVLVSFLFYSCKHVKLSIMSIANLLLLIFSRQCF